MKTPKTATIEKHRHFLIKVSAELVPGLNASPKKSKDWNDCIFETGRVRRTLEGDRLPKRQTEIPKKGDLVFVWINTSHGRVGHGLTARGEVRDVEETSDNKLRIQVRRTIFYTLNTLSSDDLINLMKPGNVFDDIKRQRAITLRYLSDDWVAQLERAIGRSQNRKPLKAPRVDRTASDDKTNASNEISRQKRLGERASRPQQQKFSRDLRHAYNGKCAVSGCSTSSALEAAHIRVLDGVDDNHISNGILLRADVHALLDSYLITMSSDGRRIELSPRLTDQSYYWLKKVKIRPPFHGKGPSKENIAAHRKGFRNAHAG